MTTQDQSEIADKPENLNHPVSEAQRLKEELTVKEPEAGQELGMRITKNSVGHVVAEEFDVDGVVHERTTICNEWEVNELISALETFKEYRDAEA